MGFVIGFEVLERFGGDLETGATGSRGGLGLAVRFGEALVGLEGWCRRLGGLKLRMGGSSV